MVLWFLVELRKLKVQFFSIEMDKNFVKLMFLFLVLKTSKKAVFTISFKLIINVEQC